jgi:CheY-like chemotaxis protein
MVASNAFEGLELIKNSLPDLVLSDLRMRVMDGCELLDEIRALGPDAGGNVPVIAMSAFFSQTDRARTPAVNRRSTLGFLSALVLVSRNLWLNSCFSFLCGTECIVSLRC